MNVHLRICAALHLVFGALTGLMLLAMSLAALITADRGPGAGSEASISPAAPSALALWLLAPLLLWILLAVLGALRALRGSAHGRWMLLTAAFLEMVAVPVGTLMAVYTLWAIWTHWPAGQRVMDPEWRRIAAQRRRPGPRVP